MSDWIDDLARRLAASSLSRREFAGLALGGAAAMIKVPGSRKVPSSKPCPAAPEPIPPDSACPSSVQLRGPCGPIPCPFDGSSLTYVGDLPPKNNGPCVINPGFSSAIAKINTCAAQAGVTVNVVSAGRNYIPANGKKYSAHLAGDAIDMYLSWTPQPGVTVTCRGADLEEGLCTPGGKQACLCWSEIEQQGTIDPTYPPYVFIECITCSTDAPALRWGGFFSNPDPVHIDNGCEGCHKKCWQDGAALMLTTGLTCCGDSADATCINTQTDNNNCGGCGVVCSEENYTCINGACVCDQQICGNYCVPDSDSCGYCYSYNYTGFYPCASGTTLCPGSYVSGSTGFVSSGDCTCIPSTSTCCPPAGDPTVNYWYECPEGSFCCSLQGLPACCADGDICGDNACMSSDGVSVASVSPRH
jgi:hypothetical protein